MEAVFYVIAVLKALWVLVVVIVLIGAVVVIDRWGAR
jgi:hypothetical protein